MSVKSSGSKNRSETQEKSLLETDHALIKASKGVEEPQVLSAAAKALAEKSLAAKKAKGKQDADQEAAQESTESETVAHEGDPLEGALVYESGAQFSGDLVQLAQTSGSSQNDGGGAVPTGGLSTPQILGGVALLGGIAAAAGGGGGGGAAAPVVQALATEIDVTKSELDGEVSEDAAEPELSGQIVTTNPDAILTFTSDKVQGIYGSFHINAFTGEWVYTLDNGRAATQALGSDDEVEETFLVTVRDDKGATDTQEVTIYVLGTNDVPVLTAGVQRGLKEPIGEDGYWDDEPTFSATVASLVEDRSLLGGGEDWEGNSFYVSDVAIIQLQVNDVDANNTHSLYFSGSNANVGPSGIFARGDYGYAFIESQQVIYILDSSNPATQALARGQVVTELFTIEVNDESGTSTATSTVDVLFTITGTNDAPTVAFVPSEDNGFVPYHDGRGSSLDSELYPYWVGNTRTVGEDGVVSFNDSTGRQFNALVNNSIVLRASDVDNFTNLNLVDSLSGETALNNAAFAGGEDFGPFFGEDSGENTTFIVEAQTAIKTIDILVTDEQGAVAKVPAQPLGWGGWFGEDGGLQVVLGTNRQDNFAFVGNTKDAVLFGFDGDDIYNFQVDGTANHITIADWVNTPFGEDGDPDNRNDEDFVDSFYDGGVYSEYDSIAIGSQLNVGDTLKVMFDNDWAQALQYAPETGNGSTGTTGSASVPNITYDTVTDKNNVLAGGDNAPSISGGAVAGNTLAFVIDSRKIDITNNDDTLYISDDGALSSPTSTTTSKASVTASEFSFTFDANGEAEMISLLTALQAKYAFASLQIGLEGDGVTRTGLYTFQVSDPSKTFSTAGIAVDDFINDYVDNSTPDTRVRSWNDGTVQFADWYNYGDRITVTIDASGQNWSRTYQVDTLGGVSGNTVATYFEDQIRRTVFNDTDIKRYDDQDGASDDWIKTVVDVDSNGTLLTIYNQRNGTNTSAPSAPADGAFTVSSAITEHSHMTFDGSWAQGNLHVIGAEYGAHLIRGGSGNDTLIGGNGFESVWDSSYDDVGRDTIYGGAGNDWIDGRAGDDLIFGGDGSDTIYGGTGNDTISAGLDNDIIYGGRGNDLISLSDQVGIYSSDTIVFEDFLWNGRDTIDGFFAGALDSNLNGQAPGGDVLDFSAFLGVGGILNNVTGGAITAFEVADLTDGETPLTVGASDAKLIVGKVAGLGDFDEVNEIATALNGGALEAIQIAVGGKAVLILAEDEGSAAEVFFIHNRFGEGTPGAPLFTDGVDAIPQYAPEIMHVASLTNTNADMIDKLLAANFDLIA